MNDKERDKKAAELLKRAYALKSEEETRTLYRDWAVSYDETMLEGLQYTTPRETALLLRQYLDNDEIRILDVGCGTGLAGAELARLGYSNIDALDYSAEMLEVAASRKVYAKFFKADLNSRLELQDNTYDAMICTGTFTHAHVGAECLDELFRILKPSALFACTVHFDVWEPAGFAQKVAQLENAGILHCLERKPGTYFETSEDNEGWFIVWQKAK